MRIFIALSFAALAVLYWAVSGGPAFVPETRTEALAGSGAAADVEVTRAEGADADLVAPAPEVGALTLEPAAVAAASPPVRPEGLSETALGPDEALAALAPELAAPDLAAAEAVAPAALVEAALPASATPDGLGAPRRAVTGDRVNLREGPGTGFGVVGQLLRGEEAEVLELREGWAWVRVGASEGWMSERFLAAP